MNSSFSPRRRPLEPRQELFDWTSASAGYTMSCQLLQKHRLLPRGWRPGSLRSCRGRLPPLRESLRLRAVLDEVVDLGLGESVEAVQEVLDLRRGHKRAEVRNLSARLFFRASEREREREGGN